MTKAATFLLALMLGSPAFAQAPTPPSPADQAQREVKYLSTVLSLTTAQQEQAKTIYISSATSEQTIHSSMRQAHEALRTAVKNNDTAGIDEAANTIGLLTAQLESARAKADAALYQCSPRTNKPNCPTCKINMRASGDGRTRRGSCDWFSVRPLQVCRTERRRFSTRWRSSF